MCGIAGVLAFASERRVDSAVLGRMGAAIAHRGPDDQGIYIDATRRVGLVHQRLSIIDLAGGHQPMLNAKQSLCIVFNGEIYNFPELRRDLVERGYVFATRSDTEVILHLFAEYGTDAFRRLNGIFAVAVYEPRTETLVLARDPFGVKPLYYSEQAGRLLFGSELKAILADPGVRRKLDVAALDEFLKFRFSPSPSTLFAGIRKLEPGHWLSVRVGGQPLLQSFADPPAAAATSISLAEAVEEYDRLLQAAVRRQMLSDVPVGLFLSGGLDSASVGICMREAGVGNLRTFSVGFEGQGDYNELSDARETAQLLGSDHHELLLTQRDYLSFYPRSFQFTEEPIAETTIPALWYLARLGAEHNKVVLAGQGADELLAGYRRYVAAKRLDGAVKLLSAPGVGRILSVLPRGEGLKRAMYTARGATRPEQLLRLLTIFTEDQRRSIYNFDTRLAIEASERQSYDRLLSQAASLPDSLAQALFLDARLGLPDDLLLFNDKMTMANSLEMRVPFLDLELVRFVESLPSAMKFRGRARKLLHRRWAAQRLPPAILRRKKRGFATPMDEWLQSGLTDFVRDLLTAPGSACREYFQRPELVRLVEEHRQRRQDNRLRLFALMSFELWHRTFFANAALPDEILPDAA